jgi:ABC-type dipeptide/oligopeptide/nickel transport system ATPase component
MSEAVHTSGTDDPLFEVRDLAVSFANGNGPRIQAVAGVRLSIYPGQTLAVVGESGCGKSVTAMTTLQLIPNPPGRIDRGEVVFRDASGAACDLLKLDASGIRNIRGNEIAMIFQEPMTSLNPVYTVGDQILEAITLHQRVSRKRAREIAVEAMDAVGIPEPAKRLRAYPHQFSGGMRQRVMIAMALACEPRLLLADEPTTALDVTIQAQILDLLSSLKRERGTAVMLITHDLGVVAEYADVVCVMYAGRVVEYAPVVELFESPRHPYTRGLLACIPRLGDRRDRLSTIAEVVDRADAFTPIDDGDGKLTPWWPWHAPPQGVATSPLEYALHRLPSGYPHWVGVWDEPDREREDDPPRIPSASAMA